MSHLSASFSATLRVRLDDRPGAFAELARVIADTGASLEAIDLVRSEPGVKVRDVTVLARDADHIAAVAAAAEELASVEVEHVSDRTFLMHLGGKIEMALKAPLGPMSPRPSTAEPSVTTATVLPLMVSV